MNNSGEIGHSLQAPRRPPRAIRGWIVWFILAVGVLHGAAAAVFIWSLLPERPQETFAIRQPLVPTPAITIPHRSVINDIAFTSEGLLVTAGSDGCLNVWEIDPVRLVAASNQQFAPIRSIAISADPPALYAVSKGLLKVWSLKPLTPLFEHLSEGSEFRTVRVAASAALLATLDRNEKVALWDLRPAGPVRRPEFDRSQTWGLFPLGLTLDGKLLAFGDREAGKVHVRRLDGGPTRSFPFENTTNLWWDFTFLGPKHQLAICGTGSLCVWDTDTGAEVRGWYHPNFNCHCLGASADGQLLAGAYLDVIVVRDVSSGAEVFSTSTGRSAIIRIVFSPDGHWLAALHYDYFDDEPGHSEVTIWRLKHQK